MSLGLGEDLAQVVQTATPGGSDAADGHVELLGDLLVGKVVVAHEQAEQALAAGREPLGRIPDHGQLLVPQQAGIERIDLVVDHQVQRIGRGDVRAPRGDPQALPPRCGGQPRAEALRLLNPVEVLHQAQPRRLAHLGHVGIVQPAPPGDGDHQPSEAPDEDLPGRAGPGTGLRHDQGQVLVLGNHSRRVVQRTFGPAHRLFHGHKPKPPDTAKSRRHRSQPVVSQP